MIGTKFELGIIFALILYFKSSLYLKNLSI